MSKGKRQTSRIRLVLLGPQGSGKGTQAATLAKLLRLPHISTGEIFREHLKHRTALGRKVSKLLDAGKLVPDSITNAIVKERLSRPDAKRGYLLDGFPRTNAQARFLETIAPPALVIALELSDRAAITRLSGRRMAPNGRIYHLKYNPPPKRLLKQVVIRDDDKPAAVRKRLSLYRKQTSPLLRWYRSREVLAEVDASPAIKRVTATIVKLLRQRLLLKIQSS